MRGYYLLVIGYIFISLSAGSVFADPKQGKTDRPDSPVIKSSEQEKRIAGQARGKRANYKSCIWKNDEYGHGAPLCVGGWISHCYDGTWVQSNRKCIVAKPK